MGAAPRGGEVENEGTVARRREVGGEEDVGGWVGLKEPREQERAPDGKEGHS